LTDTGNAALGIAWVLPSISEQDSVNLHGIHQG
jgi:hypothetical protein